MTVEMIPLRHAAQVLVSNVDKKSADGDPAVRLVNYTDVYYNSTITPAMPLMEATATAEQLRKYRVFTGDSIITKDSETPVDIGVPAYIEAAVPDMVCGYHLAMVRPGGRLHPKFLYWALASNQTREQFAIAANGMTRYGLTYDAIESAKVPVPEVEEQRRIADFLDYQTTRIDQIISGREHQMELVTEALGASAFAALTGQTQRHRKPSSIPWAPDLPACWGTPRVNQIARMGTGHTPSRAVPEYWVDCEIPWLTTSDVHKFRRDEIDSLDATEIHISELGLANSAAVLHPAGTVALSRTASAGFSVVMGRDMATSQDFATWTCGPDLDNRFLLWCLRAMRPDLLGRLAMGSTHKTIYFPDLMSIRVPLPPKAEQRQAVAAIEAFAADARKVKSEIGRSVDLLRDFKRSLISAAVSGEFDVTSANGRGVPA